MLSFTPELIQICNIIIIIIIILPEESSADIKFS